MTEVPNATAIYGVYVCLFNTPFNIRKKSMVFDALVAGEPWSWPVIGISAAALEALALADFKNTKRGICRAHLIDRIDTARALFENPGGPLPQDQFFALYFQNRGTILTTKSENRPGARPPDFIPIADNGGLFKNKSYSFAYGRKERSYLRDLHAKHSTRGA